MFKIIWKVVLLLAILYMLSLIIKDSGGFDWKDFNYKNKDNKLETINIGFISSLTGSGALVGVKSLSAAQLAVDEINSGGGIDGKVVKLIVEDGECSKKGGLVAAQKLASQNVIGIVGGLCSSESLGIIDVIDKYNIPTISHCSSSTELSGISDYFFRVYPSDSYQGVYAADYIKNKLNIDRVSVVYLDSGWGESLKDVFSESFRSNNGTIVSEHSFSENKFNDIWTEIRNKDIELVYFLGFDDSTILAFDSLTNADNFIMFGTYVWDDDNIWDKVDTKENKVMYTVVDYGKYSADFIKKIKERGVYSVFSCIPQAYDAIKILSEAIMGDSGDPENIIQKLKDTEYLNGASKEKIQFDENGDISDISYVIKKVS